MENASKQFHFKDDVQSWTPWTANENVHASWRKPHRLPTNITAANGGCLRMTSLGTPQTSNYWEYATTWESLGVVAGQTVNAIQVEYQYRWDRAHAFKQANTFQLNTNATGPFTLCDSTGSTLATLSAAIYCADNFYGNSLEHCEHNPPSDAMPLGTPADDKNHGWATATGSSVVVPASASASNTAIRLRLWNSIQNVAFGGDHGRSHLRLKQDRVLITMTYGATAVQQRIFVV